MKRRRYENLDALRTLACFLVIWQHVSENFVAFGTGGVWAKHTADYLDLGRVGVVAFFCISGFVIPGSLRGKRFDALRDFAISRFFRLYPLFWFSIPLGILTVWTLWGSTISPVEIAKNATMIPSHLNAPWIMGLYWTLEVELVFYVVCALLYFIFGHLRLEVTLAGFLLFHLLERNGILGYNQASFFLSLMFLMATLRGLYEMSEDDKQRFRVFSILFAACAVKFSIPIVKAVKRTFTDSTEAFWNKFGYGHSLGIFLFVVFLCCEMDSNWAVRTGAVTYSIYLFHPVIFNPIAKLVAIGYFPLLRIELYIVIVFLFTTLFSMVTYRFIEKPCINLGKRFRKNS